MGRSLNAMRFGVMFTFFLSLLFAACTLPAPRAAAPGAALAGTPEVPEPEVPVTATPAPLGKHPIYVLDPRDGDLVTQILVVDAETQRVVRTFRARYTPNLVFSPDGRRLYVADSYYTQVIRGEWRDVLSVYDPVTFELLHDEVPIPGRLKYKVFPLGRRYLFLSPDGRRLFVRKYGDSDAHRLRLTVLDTETFDVLAEYPACPNGDLWPLPDDRLACVDGTTVQVIEALTGEATHTRSLPVSVVASAMVPAGDRLYLVTKDARVATLDVTAHPPQLIGEPVALDAPADAPVASYGVVPSPDGARLYVRFLTGDWQVEGLNAADEIRAFDTATWSYLGIFTPDTPTWNMALSADGRQLYTVNPWERTLLIFDTTTFEEIGAMRDLSETPALILVPPAG